MIKRKRKLIDKRFQLKTTMKIVSISTLSILFILGVIGFKALQRNREIFSTIDHLSSAVEVEDNIINAFVDFSREFVGQRIRLAVQNINKDHDKSIKTINRHITSLKAETSEYNTILAIVIAVAVLQVVFFLFYLIRLTHRISGPVYVISNYVRDLIKGKKPADRDLRPNDEFKDLYDLVRKLGEKIEKEKGKRRTAKKSTGKKT